ncbi:MAG: MoaD/ThiS family protein [Candidatus Bathyarchaeia archaeon]
MLVALDEGLTRLTDSLKDADKVKILPPISGGAPIMEVEA